MLRIPVKLMREQRKKHPKKNTSMIHDEQASRLDGVKYVK